MGRLDQTSIAGRRRASWLSVTRAVLSAAGLAALAASVQAGSETQHCTTLHREPLRVDLSTEGTTLQQFVLKAGDILTVRFETGAIGAFGSLTLREGVGAPRALLLGPTDTSVDFAAAKTGAFVFDFSKEAPEPATFSVSCLPAGRAQARRTMSGSPGSRRAGRLLGSTLEDVEPWDTDDPTGVVLDAGIAAASPGVTPSLSSGPRPVAAAMLAPSGLDVRMQWRGESYAASGPGNLEAENAASGVNAALNYKVLPEIMVGALGYFDEHERTIAPGPLVPSDHAWMAGPVAAIKLGPGLSLDARAAWGVAERAPDPVAAHTTSTARREVSARISNTQSFGAWRFAPSISVSHFQETAAAPEPTPNEPTGPHTSGSGRVEMGPEIAYRIDLDKSVFIEPRAVVGSFWDIDSLSRIAPGDAAHGDMRLKAEAGVTVGATDGAKLQAAGGVEEGAQGTSNVWSGRLQLSVPIK